MTIYRCKLCGNKVDRCNTVMHTEQFHEDDIFETIDEDEDEE